MLRKSMATAAALMLGAGLSLAAVAAPASATVPGVSGDAVCNTDDGSFDVTWTVRGDARYPDAAATIKEVSIEPDTGTDVSPLIDKTVQADGSVQLVQSGAAAGTAYTMTVAVQWSTYEEGKLVTATGSVTPSGDCSTPSPEPKDASAAVSVTPATCEASGSLTLGDVTGATWGEPTTTGSTYTVVATADEGFVFQPDSSPGVTVAPDGSTKTFTGELPGKLSTDDPTCAPQPPEKKDAAAAVTVSSPTCQAPGALVLGDITGATWGEPTTAGSTYTVVATADDGYVFQPDPSAGVTVAPDGSTKTFTGELPAVLDPTQPPCVFEPPTLALVTPTVAVTQPTCDAPASFTLGGIEGAQFTWTVNGAGGYTNGTYPAPAAGGDLVVTATPANPKDGLQDWVNPATYSVKPALNPALCGDLPTLAYTGTGSTDEWVPAGSLAALALIGGVALVAFASRKARMR